MSRFSIARWLGCVTILLVLRSVAMAEEPKTAASRPVLLFTVPEYCEGIVFDHAGNGYISHGAEITRFTPDGKRSLWATTGAPNGHKILADGTHLVCDKSQHAVLRLSANGKPLTPAATDCDGKPLRGPNDLTLDTPHGGFYFTDPEESDLENRIGTVHYVDHNGKTSLIDHGLAYPNGIVLSPDGKRLWVGESMTNRVLVYEVEGPGKVKNRKIFAQLPLKNDQLGQINNLPDGMCLDDQGNLYVAHYGMQRVQVLDPSGKWIKQLDGGNLTTSNVAFGGPKMNRLFVTGGLATGQGGLFRLDLEGTKGLTITPQISLHSEK
ncbi:SMP-30/gluconolactonase/LRE family protein [Bremerella cremea]|nr:SMP-30/gluconolactonase/LRE family protein [Bremerella cremea]